jgi:Zn-dependent protease with chaperone function
MLCVVMAGSAWAQSPKLKDVKIRGYVTEVRSPTSFDIEDYRITRDQALALDFDNPEDGIAFALGDIRVGVELEIRGLLNEQTGEMTAKAIRVDLEQFKSSKQTAIVSRIPDGITRAGTGWIGELNADGQTIRVTPQTQVVFRPTKREKQLAERQKKNASAEDDEFEPLSSLGQVTVGMTMTYEGKRDLETRKIMAERVEFSTNDLEDGEARLWNSLKTTVRSAQGVSPGELKIDQIGKFKLVPDPAVQEYVASIGRRLIPAHQAELPDGDPRKIPFQFHVVLDDNPNAFATPNGIVVVHSGLIEMLDNEAQLAAVVGHEIAHSTHEHTWRQQQFHKKKRFAIAMAGAVAAGYGLGSLADLANLVNAAIASGHSRSLENQADRVGLQYMVQAGYDPREAPAVWKLMAKKTGVRGTNFFYSTHENHATRRSYLMNELKNNYRDVNYGSLVTHTAEYSTQKAALESSRTGKPTTLRVTPTQARPAVPAPAPAVSLPAPAATPTAAASASRSSSTDPAPVTPSPAPAVAASPAAPARTAASAVVAPAATLDSRERRTLPEYTEVGKALEAATVAENARDWVAALHYYENARKLAPSMTTFIDSSIERVRAQQGVGSQQGSVAPQSAVAPQGGVNVEDALRRARQYDAVGRANDAIEWYRRAYGSMLDSDPNKRAVAERIEALRSGR